MAQEDGPPIETSVGGAGGELPAACGTVAVVSCEDTHAGAQADVVEREQEAAAPAARQGGDDDGASTQLSEGRSSQNSQSRAQAVDEAAGPSAPPDAEEEPVHPVAASRNLGMQLAAAAPRTATSEPLGPTSEAAHNPGEAVAEGDGLAMAEKEVVVLVPCTPEEQAATPGQEQAAEEAEVLQQPGAAEEGGYPTEQQDAGEVGVEEPEVVELDDDGEEDAAPPAPSAAAPVPAAASDAAVVPAQIGSPARKETQSYGQPGGSGDSSPSGTPAAKNAATDHAPAAPAASHHQGGSAAASSMPPPPVPSTSADRRGSASDSYDLPNRHGVSCSHEGQHLESDTSESGQPVPRPACPRT